MPVVLPADLTTKLAAVNVLLQSISESPVSSIDAGASVDVAAAVQTLDEIERRVQIKGWHWNREEDWELSPDVDGEIVLPANYLWIGSAYWTGSRNKARVAERARKLYDRDNHTFIFTEGVSVDMVLKLQWEEMPEYARQAITEAAAEVFQVRLQGSSIVERVSEKAVQTATALLEQREDEAEEANAIGGNKAVSTILYGGPRRRR